VIQKIRIAEKKLYPPLEEEEDEDKTPRASGPQSAAVIPAMDKKRKRSKHL
jgi:hypothetical protein